MRNTITLWTLLFLSGTAVAEEKKPPQVTYDDHVKPILQKFCFSCHNPDKKSADLDLTNYTNLMQGGASGVVIEPGDAGSSYLYKLVSHASQPYMPPESPKLADESIETLRKWIEGGVLENVGSTARASKKKKFDMALSAPSTARPEVVPMPPRLSLQPVVYTATRTATDALAANPWAPLVAVGSQKQVLLYNTQTLNLVGVLPFPEGTPRSLKFSRSGGLLIAGGGVGGASGRVVVWDIRTGERIIELGDELDEVLAADISSDQTLIALGGPQRVVRIYATETGQLMHEIRKHTDWVTSLEFSPDSVLLASGDRNGGLYVWEGWTGREYLTLKGHTAGVGAVSWRSDSNVLASSSEDSTIRLWEMENGAEVKNWGAHGGGALSVEFTRDGRLFSCGRDRVAKLWDQNGGQQVAFETFGELALQATFCNETNRAICGDLKGEIRVWNATDGARAGELVMNPPTLEQRLESANQWLVIKQNEYAPLDQAYRTSQAAYEKVRQDYATALQRAMETKTAADAANLALNAAKETQAKIAAEYSMVAEQMKALSSGLSMLQEAADKASAAAAGLSNDPQLAEAVRTIQVTLQAKSQELQAMEKTVAEKKTLLDAATEGLAAAQQAASTAKEAMLAAQQEAEVRLALVKPAEDGANHAKQALDQATGSLHQAQSLVARWQDEIAFSNRLAELKSQRAAAGNKLAALENELAQFQTQFDEATAIRNKAMAELTAVQQQLAQNDMQYKSALAAVAVAQHLQETAAKEKNQINEQLTRALQLAAMLRETKTKADEALALAKEDQGLVDLTNSLKQLQENKAKEAESYQLALAAKTDAERAAIAQIAEQQQAAAALLAAQAPLQAKLAELTQVVAGLVEQSNRAQAAVAGSASMVAAAQKEVDSIRAEIVQLQGIGSP